MNLTAAMNGVSNINTRLKSPSSVRANLRVQLVYPFRSAHQRDILPLCLRRVHQVPNATLVNDLRDAGSAQTSLYFRLEDTKASIEDFAKVGWGVSICCSLWRDRVSRRNSPAPAWSRCSQTTTQGRCADNIAVICTADAQCGTTCEFAAKASSFFGESRHQAVC